jgi:hypothetical protein
MWAICDSKCKLARNCGRHKINAPSQKVRNQERHAFEPEFGKDCYGFIDLNDHQIDGQHDKG